MVERRNGPSRLHDDEDEDDDSHPTAHIMILYISACKIVQSVSAHCSLTHSLIIHHSLTCNNSNNNS